MINNITGLGAVFARETLLTRLVSRLYRLALRRDRPRYSSRIATISHCLSAGISRLRDRARCCPARASTSTFRAQAGRRPAKPLTFLFAARLLWDKGVREYVEAARIVRAESPDVRFEILGIVEPGRSAVSAAQLRDWDSEGVVSYLGASDDVRDALGRADCVGVARLTIAKACRGSCWRPPQWAFRSIASDAPGCRDAVEDGITGFLCAPRDVGLAGRSH